MIETACYRVLMIGLIWATPSATTGSVEDAEKEIISRFNKIQSLAATITNEESQDENGRKTSVVITRDMEWKRKGTGFLYRAQTVMTTTIEDAAGRRTQKSTTTTVSDGERVVSLADHDGMVKATQRRADVTVTPDLRAMFEQLRTDSQLKRLPDVKVGVHDCYAIQVIPKVRKGSDLVQTMIYFRKDIGLDVRTVVYGRDNKVLFTSTTTNVQLNPVLPEDRFVITIPDGVEMIDETGR